MRAPRQARGGSAIFVRIVNTCWRLFRGVIAVAVVAALAVGGYFALRIDDEARRLAEAALGVACEPLVARVGGATFTGGNGVTLRDVEIVEQRPGHPPECVMRADSVRVDGQFDVATLLRERPRLKRIVIERPTLCATRDQAGVWNFSRWRVKTGGDQPPPEIVVRNGAVQVIDHATESAPAQLQNVQAAVGPAEEGGLRFEASVEGGYAKRIAAAGEANAGTGAFRIHVEAQDAAISETLAALIAKQSGYGGPIPTLRGRVSFAADASRAGATAPLAWRASFSCEDGHGWAPHLNHPITALRLEGDASNDHLKIDRATARWGDASVAAVGHLGGWSLSAPAAVRFRCDGLDLAAVPPTLLPAQVRKLRDRFSPAGVVSVTAEAEYDGRRWAPKATILADNASFEDREKFRYRLTRGAGRIDINGGAEASPTTADPNPADGMSVDLDLTAMVEATPVRISAALHGIDPKCDRRATEWTSADPPRPRSPMPLGWVEVSGVGVPISDAVIEALDPEPTKRLLRSLRPSGRVDLRWRAERNHPEEPQPVLALDLRLADCRINYDRFPYPLHRVTGWVRQRGRHWTLHDLASRDGRGAVVVTGSGDLVPAGADAKLSLRLVGAAVPLDETLRAALPDYAKQAWEFLQPRGRVDFDALVTHRVPAPGAVEPSGAPDVRLSIRPHQRSVAVEPAFATGAARYRLARVDGRFDWEDGRLTMRAARAEHGRTAYETDGVWETSPDGAWRLELTRLNADRLDLGRDFLLASPVGLRSVVESLQPRGGFELFDSTLRVVRSPGGSRFNAQWDLGIDCHQATIQAGVPLEGLSGSVRLGGATDGVNAQTAGEVDLDTFFWNDLQLTDVRGPIWADAADCWIGEGVARKVQGERRRVTAKAYGGDVAINGHIRHGQRPQYGLQVDMRGVDVRRVAAEWLQRPEAIGGRLNGNLEIRGSGVSVYGMQGRGALAIDDADLYDLPVLARLLKVLRNRAPDDTAFDRCEAEFDLHGEQLAFSKLDLLGDAFSLYGHGQATLDRQLNLTFGGIVGRNDFAIPMLKSLVGQASEQLLRVRVTGSADAPQVRREALPMVGEVFEQLQADLRAPNPAAAQEAPAPPGGPAVPRASVGY